jgi:hypothetical protein
VRTQKGFSSFQLKIVALVLMTIDHIAAMGLLSSFPQIIYDIFRGVGRIAAPLFLFILVQGLRHTRSKPKYIFRLYVAAVLIEIANTFFRLVAFSNYPFDAGNILPTFMYTALYTICIEHIIGATKNKDFRKAVLAVAGMVAPFIAAWVFKLVAGNEAMNVPASAFFPLRGADALKIFLHPINSVEYSLLFVALGVAWYFINRKTIDCLVFVVLSGICYILDYTLFTHLPFANILSFNFFQLFLYTQWCMVFAVPFILLYNGQRGKSLKLFFYAYYPLHQYLLFWMAVMIFGD